MRLDAVLPSPDIEWLTTPSEKSTCLPANTRSEPSPAAVGGGAGAPDLACQWPGTLPIGIDPSGHVVLLYLVTVPWTDDFRRFLMGHVGVLSATPNWILRLVFPPALSRALDAHRIVVHEELETPLDAKVIYDLRRYFFHRRRRSDLDTTIPDGLRSFIVTAGQRFAAPRFTHLYRRWLTEEEAVFTPISPAIPKALAAGCGQLECVVLRHTYDHLSPLVTRRDLRRWSSRERTISNQDNLTALSQS